MEWFNMLNLPPSNKGMENKKQQNQNNKACLHSTYAIHLNHSLN